VVKKPWSRHIESIESVKVLLCSFWQLLATFGNFWQLLATFGNFELLSETFGRNFDKQFAGVISQLNYLNFA
jgi:hypothetical protein